MMRQFSDRIGRVRRRDDASGPMTAPGHRWSIDAVLTEECENISFPPIPMRTKTGAELLGCLFEAGVGVITSCDWTLVNYWEFY
jgi:hypothetical protein